MPSLSDLRPLLWVLEAKAGEEVPNLLLVEDHWQRMGANVQREVVEEAFDLLFLRYPHLRPIWVFGRRKLSGPDQLGHDPAFHLHVSKEEREESGVEWSGSGGLAGGERAGLSAEAGGAFGGTQVVHAPHRGNWTPTLLLRRHRTSLSHHAGSSLSHSLLFRDWLNAISDKLHN